MSVVVLNSGMLTTIQDGGRKGYQRYGVSQSGVMDIYAYNVANLILGNEKDAAVLEATFTGPTLRFECNQYIALTGADMGATLNDNPINMWESVKVCSGDELKLGTAVKGLRTYIAFTGGILTEVQLGSRSTYIKGKLGGIEGRALKTGDILPISATNYSNHTSYFDASLYDEYYNSNIIRFIYGPQDDYFDLDQLQIITESEYTITNECDRMGIRLDGGAIKPKSSSDIISDGISFGSIQIPSHGQPIVMMADRQTTGGYAKIGTVITSDLGLLSQKRPGDKIVFKSVTVHEAQTDYKNQYNNIVKGIKQGESNRQIGKFDKEYNIKVNGKDYNVKLIEIK